eukprot:1156905-Pelagomonas_calceolata.AAC.6
MVAETLELEPAAAETGPQSEPLLFEPSKMRRRSVTFAEHSICPVSCAATFCARLVLILWPPPLGGILENIGTGHIKSSTQANMWQPTCMQAASNQPLHLQHEGAPHLPENNPRARRTPARSKSSVNLGTLQALQLFVEWRQGLCHRRIGYISSSSCMRKAVSPGAHSRRLEGDGQFFGTMRCLWPYQGTLKNPLKQGELLVSRGAYVVHASKTADQIEWGTGGNFLKTLDDIKQRFPADKLLYQSKLSSPWLLRRESALATPHQPSTPPNEMCIDNGALTTLGHSALLSLTVRRAHPVASV